MKEWNIEQWKNRVIDNESFVLYLYTPMCGTCMLASKMLNIIEAMKPSLSFGKMDLNYAPQLAKKYEVESVPCLLIIKNGELVKKIYRFESVPHLLERVN